MVDITKGIGGVQGGQSQTINKTQTSRSDNKPGATSASGEVEINISQEALSISQAETTARNARSQLENSNLSLSRGSDLEKFLS